MAASLANPDGTVLGSPRSPKPSWLRRMVDMQARWSSRLDERLPPLYRIDGNRDFLDHVVPQYLETGAVVYDVGGGKNPVVNRGLKQRRGLQVIGLDIDASELAAVPEGSYDRTICADITGYQGAANGDLVICQALLEHVTDTESALGAIAGMLKPGGRALVFVPSRNAIYARLNLMLPERLKRRILFGIFPEMRRDHGFRAYYDRCTPGEIGRSALACGLTPERLFLYYRSDYFRFCFPLHAFWRAWVALFRLIARDEAAETFTFVFRKPE